MLVTRRKQTRPFSIIFQLIKHDELQTYASEWIKDANLHNGIPYRRKNACASKYFVAAALIFIDRVVKNIVMRAK